MLWRGSDRGYLQAQDSRYMEDEPLPHNSGYVSNPSSPLFEYERNEMAEIGVPIQPSEGQMYCIPKTQLEPLNENSGVAYLAMLARIGLDSPGKLDDPGDGNPGILHNQDEGHHIMHTHVRNSFARLMELGQPMLTLKPGRIWKHNGKSLLGKNYNLFTTYLYFFLLMK